MIASWLIAAGLQAASPATPWRPEGVSSDQFESHPAPDPLTGDLYFVRSAPNFSGWRILVSRCAGGRLMAAEPAPFSGAGVEADPYFAADGRRVYFISSRADPPAKTGDDLDIWMVERGAEGRWGAPARLPAPVNSPAAEWFPRSDGRGGLYFGSGRDGGFGQTDIYHAVPEAGGWRVENVGGTVSTADDEYEFEPSRDGRFAVLMSEGALFRLERSGSSWGPRQPIGTGLAGLHVGPTLSPSGRTLLFAARDGARSGELFRIGEGETWPASCGGGGGERG
ncbi:MAG TPA: hypothetical protein VGX37_14020 [Allosphingosinicella sp.]|nr:hypothetical protein [Allosphingosinicella sp.]